MVVVMKIILWANMARWVKLRIMNMQAKSKQCMIYQITRHKKYMQHEKEQNKHVIHFRVHCNWETRTLLSLYSRETIRSLIVSSTFDMLQTEYCDTYGEDVWWNDLCTACDNSPKAKNITLTKTGKMCWSLRHLRMKQLSSWPTHLSSLCIQAAYVEHS